jgi:integrase
LKKHVFASAHLGLSVGKMMRHADIATTMNVYGKAMMDTRLVAHTELLEYARAGGT